MKKIEAYIWRCSQAKVATALAKIERLSGVSACTVTGFGRSRSILRFVDFNTHVKIETVCDDRLKDTVVAAILDAARSGKRGDGKVFVSSIEEGYRIETGELLSANP
jgi:nitrogen regulatory protein P-II 1